MNNSFSDNVQSGTGNDSDLIYINHMGLISWNCNSIHKKNMAIRSLVNVYLPKILCLQETKHRLNSENLPSFEIRGFVPFHVPRISKNSRGLITYLHNDLEILSHNTFQDNTFEYVCVNIKIEGEITTVINFYRHESFRGNLLEVLPIPSNKFILVGDSNAHHSFWGVYNSCDAAGHSLFNEITNRSDICIINDSNPTFYCGNTTIDLALASTDWAAAIDFEVFSDFHEIHIIGPDHFPISLTLPGKTDVNTNLHHKEVWDLPRADWDVFKRTTYNLISTHLENFPDSPTNLDIVNNIFTIAAQASIPFKRLKKIQKMLIFKHLHV